MACCDTVNRGGVFTDSKFIFNTLDGQPSRSMRILAKRCGRPNSATSVRVKASLAHLSWRRAKFLVGVSGGEFGVRGWLTALDVNTGKVVWRAFHTGPDKDVLIGPDFHPFYAQDHGKDLGVTTWPPDAWKIGGGTNWGWMAYDPDLNLSI